MGRLELEDRGEPLFTAGGLRCLELDADAVPVLQAFFAANPEYHIAVNGAAPGADAALEQFESLPPAGWPFTKRWMLGFWRPDGTMGAMASAIANLFVEGVWHLGLFIVATPLHGKGTAHELYRALESWMRANGARWVRLGVVDGNRRAERFWERHGPRPWAAAPFPSILRSSCATAPNRHESRRRAPEPL